MDFPSILKLRKFLQITLVIYQLCEFCDWTVENKFAIFWYCRDLCHCSVLKVAIKKAIHKPPHDVQLRHLFCDENDENKISLWGLSIHTGWALL
jgi:hypothetical protein